MICFFFFSSRRRHTRSLRDWSSDVCSSDLDEIRDLVSGEPNLPGGKRVHRAADLRLLEHIEQAKAHFELSVGKPLCLPDDHGVGEATFPFREIDLGDLGGNLSYPADKKRARA